MKFFGGLLMGIGILITTLSGLCSAWFLVMLVASPGSGGEFGGSGMLVLIAVIGGLPFASGIGLFFAGRALVRAARARGE
jgi:hypothetical protein